MFERERVSVYSFSGWWIHSIVCVCVYVCVRVCARVCVLSIYHLHSTYIIDLQPHLLRQSPKSLWARISGSWKPWLMLRAHIKVIRRTCKSLQQKKSINFRPASIILSDYTTPSATFIIISLYWAYIRNATVPNESPVVAKGFNLPCVYRRGWTEK